MALPRIWLDLKPHPSTFDVLEGTAEIIGPLVRPDPGNALSEIEDADGVLATTQFPATRETFERAAKLKVVARYGIGLDSVDIEAATDCGICVVHTPDAPTISVSEFTIGLMIAVSRKLLTLDQVIRSGGWNSIELMGQELYGKKVGLIGCGRIGARVAKILKAFECEVGIFDPYVSDDKIRELSCIPEESLEVLLKTSDIVSLHLPMTPDTRGLLGKDQFSMMKPEAIVINVSRGPIIVEADLYTALVEEQIAGAGLDVFEEEPTSAYNPLFKLDNVVLAPHAASFTWDAKARSNPGAAEQALQVIRGDRPTHLANPEVWEKRRT